MLTLITSLLLLGGAPQDTAAAPAPEARTELLTAAKKLTELESYSFTIVSESKRVTDGAEGEGPGDRVAGRGPRESVPMKGAWMSGRPMQVSVGETRAYKNGEQVVYRDEAGEWKLLEFGRGGFDGAPPAGGRADGRRPGRGERGGERGEAERGPDRRPGAMGARGRRGGNMRALFGLRRVEPPHKLLADLGDELADVKKTAEGDILVFTGTLTEEGARTLGGGGRGFGGRGGPGARRGGGNLTTTGTCRVETKDGRITKVVLEIKRSGGSGERTFEMTTKRTISFSEIGKTKYEVPEEVLAHFEI